MDSKAPAGRLEVRLASLDREEVLLLGERGRPVCALKVRAPEAHAYPPRPLSPLRLGTYVGGVLVWRDLGFLEPIELSADPPPPNQPGLGLIAPLEEAWATAQKRFRIVEAPF